MAVTPLTCCSSVRGSKLTHRASGEALAQNMVQQDDPFLSSTTAMELPGYFSSTTALAGAAAVAVAAALAGAGALEPTLTGACFWLEETEAGAAEVF